MLQLYYRLRVKIGKNLPIFAFLLIIIGLFVVFINSPSRGKIKRGEVKERQIDKIVNYQGSYLKFSYWDRYVVRIIDNNEKNILENLQLLGKSGIPASVVITLKKNPVGSLEDISGVKMRQIDSNKYEQEQIYWGGYEGLLFSKKTDLEITAFFMKEGKSLTVALTASANDQKKYRQEFEELVRSIELKKDDS